MNEVFSQFPPTIFYNSHRYNTLHTEARSFTLNSACCSMCLSKEGFETEVKSHSEHRNRFPVQTQNNSSYCYLSSLYTSANFCQHFGDVEYTVKKDIISDRAECTYLHRYGSICGF